jgi:hypothetical protein
MNSGNNQVLISPKQLPMAIELNEEVILAAIRNAEKDAKWKDFALKADERIEGFKWDGPYILRYGKISVPDNQNLKLLILQSRHDHKLSGHPGIR